MSAYLSLIGRSRGWALINFFCLWDGRLSEVGANSRLGAYSNKYGISGEGGGRMTVEGRGKQHQLGKMSLS